MVELELLTALRGKKRDIWEQFLLSSGITPEELPEKTVLLWDGNVLAATGSLQGNLFKYLATEPLYQGQGLLATVLTALRQEAFLAGHRHLFLYTKPQNEPLFLPLLFYPVASTDKVLLMEDHKNGIQSFLDSLPSSSIDSSAIVMNCDPFTLGHRYLIETAAKESEHLYVFVLSEDKGYFSAEDRLNMVKLGTKDLPNVTVLPTGPYLISSATFPTYFLKDRDSAETIHCQLDIAVFTRYYAPKFRITRRYVGTEPLSAMTAQYNAVLADALPRHGITLTQIPRKEADGSPISASRVRKALSANDWDTVRSLVPSTTFRYLRRNHYD
ncbi:MAG: [Oscillospiraceae bacterium]|nr:[citrate (pro-3S)-lyase] ligase [Oscillospiraceae bacterium]